MGMTQDQAIRLERDKRIAAAAQNFAEAAKVRVQPISHSRHSSASQPQPHSHLSPYHSPPPNSLPDTVREGPALHGSQSYAEAARVRTPPPHGYTCTTTLATDHRPRPTPEPNACIEGPARPILTRPLTAPSP